MTRSEARLGFRPDIDGLRALAVLGVVLYHAGVPWLPGGFAGVDVFFVISGYLITGLLLAEQARLGRLSLTNFYARRARRILPAVLLTIGTTLLAGSLVLYAVEDMQDLLSSAAASLAFVANEYFRLNAGGYFDGPAEWMPFLHLWSLSVEEQFYVFWPVVLMLLARWVSPTHRLLALTLLVVSGFALSNLLLVRSHELAFYSIGSRYWELGVGAWLALRDQRQRPAWSQVSASILSLLGLLLIAASYLVLEKTSLFPGVGALLPVLGAACVIAGNRDGLPAWVSHLLANRVMLRLGLLSFSWYLWHWPLLALARNYRQGSADLQQDLLLVALALVLAWFSHRFVETPFRQRQVPTATTLKLAGGVLIFSIAGALGLKAWLASQPANATLAALVRIKHDKTPYRDTCHLPNEAAFDRLPFDACIQGEGLPRVMVWGDSHANAWAPMLDAVTDSPFAVLTMSACPPLLGVTPLVAGVSLRHCRAFNDAMLQQVRLSTANGLRGVLLVARWPKYAGQRRLTLRDASPDFLDPHDRRAEASLSLLKTALGKQLDLLQGLGLRVAIVQVAPEFPEEIRRCLMHAPADRCGISRQTFEAYRAPVSRAIEQAAAGRDQVRVWDPVNFFCNAEVCPPFVGRHPASYDDNHVSASAARAYGALHEADMRWLSGQDGPQPLKREQP